MREDEVDRRDAECLSFFGQKSGNIVNREVLLAQGDHLLTNGILLGRLLGSLLRGEKEGAVEVLAKLSAKDAKAPWSISEAFGRLLGRESLNEVGSEGFVLTVIGVLGNKKGSLLFR